MTRDSGDRAWAGLPISHCSRARLESRPLDWLKLPLRQTSVKLIFTEKYFDKPKGCDKNDKNLGVLQDNIYTTYNLQQSYNDTMTITLHQ